MKVCHVSQTSGSATLSGRAFYCSSEWDKGDYFSWSLILQWLQELVKNTLNRSSLFPGHTYLKAKSFQLPVCTFYAYWITWYWNNLYTYCIFMHKHYCYKTGIVIIFQCNRWKIAEWLLGIEVTYLSNNNICTSYLTPNSTSPNLTFPA